MPQTFLITRAVEHAQLTKQDVEALGYHTLCDPMLEIVQIADAAPVSATTAAFIITSRNALAGLKNIAHSREIPLFIVGQETAELFKQAGFTNILGVSEQSRDLPKIITAQFKPNAGGLIHLTSEHAHTEFYDALLDAGFGIEQRYVYHALAAKALLPATIAALQNNQVSGVLFYSARTAEIFNTLVAGAALQTSLLRFTAYCLSEVVGAALHASQWQQIVVAKSPTHQSLMECIKSNILG